MTRALAQVLVLGFLMTDGVGAQDRGSASQAAVDRARLETLVNQVEREVMSREKLVQVMVDKIFSFSELGFQEVETSRYITGILRENGFRVEEGISGIPTAWWATWGSGRPFIALGSDLDGIPKASQRPGVAYHDPIVDGAPGHGEGHNSGQAVNVAAALALKEVMESEGLEGTLILWPGVAEELLGSKAWLVRDGRFRDLDAVLFTHVGSNFSVSWGQGNGTGLVSAEFTFSGEAAHAAGAPWRGRSALDAVELMNVAWNYRREHLRTQQRSHYVIVDGGDQPNVVPSTATVWYFVREIDQERIRENFDALIRVARGAELMTDTELSYRIVGTAYPRHFNRSLAQAMHAHIRTVGLPAWTEADRALARAVQEQVGGRAIGLADTAAAFGPPPTEPESGGSDDIGDVSWAVPTVTLYYPANIPDLPGHHWANAIAMATPIAHKGSLAGAQVLARTAIELFGRPDLVRESWAYYLDEQTRDRQYVPFIGPNDAPAIDKNRRIMDEFRPQLAPFYFDETRFDTYLEQLGIAYPTLRPPEVKGGGTGG